jgi:hypothetical protein
MRTRTFQRALGGLSVFALALVVACAPASAAGITSGVFGTGTDGTVTFDGTSTILGLAPSSSTYTMTRPIWCSGCTLNNGVTIKENGYPFYDNGKFVWNGIISDNGAAGTGAAGGAARVAGYFGATSAGGTTNMGIGSASANALCSPYLTTGSAAGGSGAHVGTNGGSGQGGGGGGSGTGTTVAGAGGTLTVYPGSGCVDLELTLRMGGYWVSGGSELTYGTGGGGGAGATNVGAGGGAGGGIVFVAAQVIAGSGSAQAEGGNGGNAAASGAGGGGGGGGGDVFIEYETEAGSVTANVSGGTGGTGNGGGSAGGNGGAGVQLKNCSTCLGMNLSGDGT